MKKIIIFMTLLMLLAGCGSKDTSINTADKMIKEISLIENMEYGILTTSSTIDLFEKYREYILEDLPTLSSNGKENYNYMKELLDLFFENTNNESEFAWIGNKGESLASGIFVYKLDNKIEFTKSKLDGINQLVEFENESDYYYVSGNYIIAIENSWLIKNNIDVKDLLVEIDTFFKN